MDRLGSLLKRRVTMLRKESEIDLVFLVDSSASVGSQNFGNEIKFVRKVSSTMYSRDPPLKINLILTNYVAQKYFSP